MGASRRGARIRRHLERRTIVSSKSASCLICSFVLLAVTGVFGAQRTAPGTWTIVPRASGDIGVTFTLGWTLGTHEGQASRVTGSVQAQVEPFVIGQGEFRVPITAMSTGSTTRDCHMREALGI